MYIERGGGKTRRNYVKMLTATMLNLLGKRDFPFLFSILHEVVLLSL